MSSPSAQYTSPSISQSFSTDNIPKDQLTTQGTTTGASDFVLSKGAIDRDGPSPHKDTAMGVLRAKVTKLQDDLNVFLTVRMKEKKEEELKESEQEKKLLDGADSDSDEE